MSQCDVKQNKLLSKQSFGLIVVSTKQDKLIDEVAALFSSTKKLILKKENETKP